VPIMPLAPARLSIKTDVFNCSQSLSATFLAMTSSQQGANGTIIRTGRLGHFSGEVFVV